MKNIKLNYMEYAFIMGIKSDESKEVFLNYTEEEKVKKSILVEVKDLMNHSGTVKSLDPRYDGLNKLDFYLNCKKDNYKKYLSESASANKCKFSGGKSIFYKILSSEQLEHAEQTFKYNYIDLHGLSNYNKRFNK